VEHRFRDSEHDSRFDKRVTGYSEIFNVFASRRPDIGHRGRARLPDLRDRSASRAIRRLGDAPRHGLDRPRADTTRATATIAGDLQACLLRERVVAVAGTPPYEAVIVWGVNGPDSTVQRVFAHSQHGRFGVYQGRRRGTELPLRQMSLSPQPDSVVVENLVVFRDRDHFTITSRLSNDRGRTWQALSRWEYRRTSS
jgi:hypothetical protein